MSEEPGGMFGKDGALETVAASLMKATYAGVETWALEGGRDLGLPTIEDWPFRQQRTAWPP